MTSKNNRSGEVAVLRKRAEEIVREKAAQLPEDIEAFSPGEIRERLHELRVHQIELDMRYEELRQAQVELDAVRTSYLDFYNQSPVGFCSINEQGLIIETNLTTATLLGASQDALINQPFTRFIQKEDQDIYCLHAKQLVEGGWPHPFDLQMVKFDGMPFWAHLTATAAKDTEGINMCRIVISDITDRKQAEEIIQDSEQRFRAAFMGSPNAVCITTQQDGVWIDANQAELDMFGFTREEIIGKSALNTNLWVDLTDRQRIVDALNRGEEVRNLNTQLRHKDGRLIIASVSSTALTLKGVKHILYVTEDITERKRIEEALRESEEKFRLTYSSSPDAVNINRLDDGLYVDINEGFIRATGYTREEVIGKTSLEIDIWHDPADRQKLLQGLQQKGYYENLEAQFQRKDGTLITALMSARVISLKGVSHIISITRDITESKLIATKLQQAQKFEAIGTLAGGIAHDFNNLLMGIQGRTSLISWDLDVSHPLQEHIQAIEEHIRSATSLTQQLLGFARGGKYEVNPVDMNELVHDSSALFGRTKKEIRIHTKYQASPLVVNADRGQIEQVLLNMYINAWQAMPPEGGELYLETKIVTLDEAYCKAYQAEPGRYAMLSITDTGAGMNEATRLQIFDPFFTTKEKGRGTGLGLASAFGIIKNHGGMITVDSEVDYGTTFSIYLPVSDKEVHREVPMEGGPIKGSATILLVDDEELIIDVGQAMLARLGYRVMVCRGGQEAVNVISDIGNIIDMVILDLIMPGMDGSTTFNRIREIQPDMPVLLSSGYAIDGHADKIMRRGCIGFIQKPYNISDLSIKVRNVLDGGKGSTQQ